MADNYVTNAGSGGDTFAADDIASVKYPRTKLIIGADGTNDGDVASGNPLPVTLLSESLAGNLDVNIAAQTADITIADGGNSITVDGAHIATEGSALGSGVLIQGDDGTDRTNVLVDTSGHLQVDVLTAPSTAVTNAGTFATQAAQSGTWNITNVSGTVSLPTGASTAANQTTIIGHVDGLEALLTTIDADTSSMNTDLGTIAAAVSTEMQVDVVGSLPAGSATIGAVALAAGTAGGCQMSRLPDVDETEDSIKGSNGVIYFIHAMNLTAAVLYLHIYDETTGNVTVGSTTPDLTFALPTQGDTNGAGFTLAIPMGIQCDTAITIAATTTIGGSSGPAANGCVVNVGFN